MNYYVYSIVFYCGERIIGILPEEDKKNLDVATNITAWAETAKIIY